MSLCGHIPDGAETFSEEVLLEETKGEWYLRQMIGSANFEGSRLVQLLAGSLGYQIEHHLFPDLPSNRYPEIAVKVRQLAEKYDLPYATGPIVRQYGRALRKLMRLALPSQRRNRGAARPPQMTDLAVGVSGVSRSPNEPRPSGRASG